MKDPPVVVANNSRINATNSMIDLSRRTDSPISILDQIINKKIRLIVKAQKVDRTKRHTGTIMLGKLLLHDIPTSITKGIKKSDIIDHFNSI